MSTTKWVIDPTHSEIGFKVKHMMFTNVSGKFQKFEASIATEGDTFENAKIEFTGAIDSLSTGNADRDGHLLSADFFDAAQYPEITFKATAVKKVDESDYEIIGDLTLHGVTKSVKLAAEYSGQMKDPWGNTKAGFALEGKINRKDWGLNWNAALETGGVLVGEEVRLAIELQFIKQ
ncbi:MAG TPA: YceI family protein [Flavobacterium sp.]|nr:YceI family protein [Flavobacterium sp.]